MKKLLLLAMVSLFGFGANAALAAEKATLAAAPSKEAVATFAGGCFWCMEPPFKIPGVSKVTVGYAGGHKANPTYEEVSSGSTGHLESVEVRYDPAKVSYNQLLDIFWQNIDPTQGDGQFADRGSQYHTAIFYATPEQKKLAEESKKKLDASGKFSRPIATVIIPAATFYPAEDYHQGYSAKNPLRYRAYRAGSGRSDFIEKVWGRTDTH